MCFLLQASFLLRTAFVGIILSLFACLPSVVTAQADSEAARKLLSLVEDFDVCTNLGFTAESSKLIEERNQAVTQLRRLEMLVDATGVKIERLEAEALSLEREIQENQNSFDKEVQQLQISLAASLARQDEMQRELKQTNLEISEQQKKLKELEAQNKTLAYEKVARETLEKEFQQLLNASNVPLAIIQKNEDLTDMLSNCDKALGALEQQLAEALAAKVKAEGERQNLTEDLQAALAARLAADALAEERLSALEQREILLAEARKSLGVSEELSEKRANELIEAAKQQELLNQQVATLRAELGKLQELLALSEQKDADSQIQLQNLGNRLNAALARAASEERKRRKLEEAERIKIESEAEKLEAERDQLADQLELWSLREKDLLAQIQDLQKTYSLNSIPSAASDIVYKKTVQELLKQKRCGVGVVDGKIGPKSIAAAKAFSKLEGIRFTGDIYDEVFYEKLTSSSRKCTVRAVSAKPNKCQEYPGNCTDFSLCVLATQSSASVKRWSNINIAHVAEARNRGLKCGVR